MGRRYGLLGGLDAKNASDPGPICSVLGKCRAGARSKDTEENQGILMHAVAYSS